jgi:soluble lytic murein transglycosylase
LRCPDRWRVVFLAVGVALLAAADGRLSGAGQDPQDWESPAGLSGSKLVPTAHPPIPDRPSRFWFVPDRRAVAGAPRPTVDTFSGSTLARGVALFEAAQYAAALAHLGDARLNASALGDYARYYTAWARLKLDHIEAASLGFDALAAKRLDGYLAQAVELRRADVALERRENARAVSILDALARRPLLNPETVLLKLAAAQERAGDHVAAVSTYRRVWSEHALLPEGDAAGQELERMGATRTHTVEGVRLELDRAEKLFGAKRWAPAREAFKDVLPAAGVDAPLVQLRIAECDYYLKRYAAARNGAEVFALRGPNAAEARFVVAAAAYGLKEQGRFVGLVRDMLVDLPTDVWSEEALNLLATHYLTEDQDDLAADVFQQMVDRFPGGRYAERASWKAGWYAYRAGKNEVAIRYFEAAAARMPRADTRPAWLYWSARAHQRLGHTAEAAARDRLVLADYQNSYYGRLAERRLGSSALPAARVPLATAPPAMGVPTESLIRELVAAELFDAAGREIRYAQRAWGDAATLQATLAWVSHRQGLNLVSWDRFNHLRGAINQMKRAYPQYIAAGGEQLPADALGVLFPLDYWNLIQQYATEHSLDPYMMAALIQQESTFTPDVKSAANAYGLMQLIPAAGRQYAKKVGLGRFSIRLLTHPESNIRMGMAYFKDLSDRFGGAHFAIASYNAGPHRVSRWRTEKPDLPDDEFIDDIPFPETQNYVKKVLGMAEDYRRIYGGGLVTPQALPPFASEPELEPEPRASAGGPRAKSAKPAAPTKAKKPVAKRPASKARSKTRK